MSNIVVLGSGIVGRLIATDLGTRYDVTVVDREAARLKFFEEIGLKTISGDVLDNAFFDLVVKDAKLVVNALPGTIGYQILERALKAGKKVVDISFFEGDPFDFNELAKSTGGMAVVDAGIAPGLCNMFLGHKLRYMEVSSYRCLVGGLPRQRDWPYEYKAAFSPIDVIAEYTRPARMVLNGKYVVKEALSEPELVEFDTVGTLEAWNTDGLRTLLDTVEVPNMVEKTLRYPNSMNYVRAISESGLFSEEPVDINGVEVRPIDVTAKLLAKKWAMTYDDKDFLVMEVRLEGIENGSSVLYEYNIYDKHTGAFSAMARTTGYTCTGVVDLIMSGKFTRPGVSAMEHIDSDECYASVIKHLETNGVSVKVRREVF